MNIRPIIFSGPMVRALLDGRKTQTRRVLKPQPPEMPAADCAPRNTAIHSAPYLDAYCGEPRTDANPRGMSRNWHWWQVDDRPGPCVAKVSATPGDHLWVREACRAVEHEDGTDAVEYLADGACVRIQNTIQAADRWGEMYHYGKRGPDRAHREGQKVPSIHMPRWASRLTLVVTDVRVQRLQEISEVDIAAEGIKRGFSGGTHGEEGLYEDFAELWNSLHGPDAWDANPWVAAYAFTVHRCNVDQMIRNE